LLPTSQHCHIDVIATTATAAAAAALNHGATPPHESCTGARLGANLNKFALFKLQKSNLTSLSNFFMRVFSQYQKQATPPFFACGKHLFRDIGF
jgi:hypothetical protein